MEGAVCSRGKVFFGSFVRCNRAHLIADPLGLGYLCKLTHTQPHTHSGWNPHTHKGRFVPWLMELSTNTRELLTVNTTVQHTGELSQWAAALSCTPTQTLSTSQTDCVSQTHKYSCPYCNYIFRQVVWKPQRTSKFFIFFQLLFRWSLLPSFSFYIKVIQSFITGFF